MMQKNHPVNKHNDNVLNEIENQLISVKIVSMFPNNSKLIEVEIIFFFQ